MALQSKQEAGARPKRFYTVKEFAKLLGVSYPTVYRAIREGKFPAIRFRGRYVIPAKAIDRLESDALAGGLVDSADLAPREGVA